MALHHLPTASLLTVSEPFVADEAIRRILRRYPLLGGFVQQLEEAHTRLADVSKTLDANRRSKQSIKSSRALVTASGDEVSSIGTWLFQFVGLLASPPSGTQEASAWPSVFEKLFPSGDSGTRRKRPALASAVVAVEARLDRSTKEQLASVNVAGGTLLDVVKNWIRAAREVLESNQATGRIVGASEAGVMDAPVTAHLHARSNWFRVVGTFTKALTLLPLTRAERDQLLGPMELLKSQFATTKRPKKSPKKTDEGKPADNKPAPANDNSAGNIARPAA